MKFYQIKNPSTEQIFNAIIDNEYTPLDKIKPKAKQVRTLLMNHFNTEEVLVTFQGVTNSGGYPIFFSVDTSINEIAQENNDNWHQLTEEEQEHEIELLSSYTQTYNQLFNL